MYTLAQNQLPSSVHATQAWEGVSSKYRFVSTANIVETFAKQGFFPVAARQAGTRIESKQGYTKHMIRFRRECDLNVSVGTAVPEIILVNSHNRGSSFQLNAGMFILACLNGLVIADKTFPETFFRMRHVGDTEPIVLALEGIVSQFPRMLAQVESMKAVILPESVQLDFARAALSLRWDTDKAPLNESSLNVGVGTAEHRDNSLWSTYQRIQSVLVGGRKSYYRSRFAPATVRKISSVDQDLRINKALWSMACRLQEVAGV